MPRREAMSDNYFQTATITAKAPQLIFRWNLSNTLNQDDKIKLAQAELKNEMIKAILDGNWIIENE